MWWVLIKVTAANTNLCPYNSLINKDYSDGCKFIINQKNILAIKQEFSIHMILLFGFMVQISTLTCLLVGAY
jgi:hypothetical protein